MRYFPETYTIIMTSKKILVHIDKKPSPNGGDRLAQTLAFLETFFLDLFPFGDRLAQTSAFWESTIGLTAS